MEILPMSLPYATQLLKWEYPIPYDFYNFEDEKGDVLEELLKDDYYAVLHKGELIGFYAYGNACRIPSLEPKEVYRDNALDYGLGLHPEYTGKGLGHTFVALGMNFAKETYYPVRLRLTVAQFNTRAIHTYQRLGFEKIGSLTASTGVTFDVMQTPML